MWAVLFPLAQWVLGQLTGQIFKRAAIFMTMNIVMGYIIQWLGSAVVQGLSISSGGSVIGNLFGSVGPMVLYIFDMMWVIPGMMLVLNVKLWRLSGRVLIKSITGS